MSPNIDLAFNIQANQISFLGNYHLETQSKIDTESSPSKYSFTAELTRKVNTVIDIERLSNKFSILKQAQASHTPLLEGSIFSGKLTPTGIWYQIRHTTIQVY